MNHRRRFGGPTILRVISDAAARLGQFRERFFESVPRFRYLDTIGRGGMGIVYKAEDLELGETIALKVLFPGRDALHQELLARFKREVSLNRRIKHPNVARLYEFGMSGDFPFITMEFVPGRTLLAWLRDVGPFAPVFAVSVLRQMALGADAAHRHGIVHRDLKSANVMVDDDGHASILDFGLARLGPGGDLSAAHLVGTPEYMAPEQALGHDIDARTDVYAIGVVGFEIITGSLPFTGGPPLTTALRHVHEPIPSTLAQWDIPTELRTLLEASLAKSPEDRPADAGVLAEALALLPGGRAIVPPRGRGLAVAPEPPPPATQAVKRPSRTERRKADSAPATVSRPRRPSVLVVETDAAERERMVEAFTASGCDARGVADGMKALESLSADRADLVVLAVALPGMDGFDVARVLKSGARTAGIPVILVTQKLLTSQVAFAQQVGAAELVARPQAVSALVWKGWRYLKRVGFLTPEETEKARSAGRAALERRAVEKKAPG